MKKIIRILLLFSLAIFGLNLYSCEKDTTQLPTEGEVSLAADVSIWDIDTVKIYDLYTGSQLKLESPDSTLLILELYKDNEIAEALVTITGKYKRYYLLTHKIDSANYGGYIQAQYRAFDNGERICKAFILFYWSQYIPDMPRISFFADSQNAIYSWSGDLLQSRSSTQLKSLMSKTINYGSYFKTTDDDQNNWLSGQEAKLCTKLRL